ncbi:MAG: YidB family protein [Gaiella sp.]
MAGLDDLLKGIQQGGGGGGLGDILSDARRGGGGGGLGDILGGMLGGGGGGQGGLGGIFGQILKGGLGGGGGSLGGGGASPMAGIMKALLPMLIGMLAGGGLGKVMKGMRANGLSSQADSWVSTGANQYAHPDEVAAALGPDQVAEIAQRLGVSEQEAAEVLSEVLPATIDHLTPDGQEPEDDVVDSRLEGLLKQLVG